MNPMTPEERIRAGLSPKLLLAAADQDFDQFWELLSEHTPIDLISALATTAYSLAVELYGSKEQARAIFATMALAADVDTAMHQVDEGEQP